MKKTPSSGKSLAGRLLTFSAFRMGAYSRRALIPGWAVIRINTVIINDKNCRPVFLLPTLSRSSILQDIYFLFVSELI